MRQLNNWELEVTENWAITFKGIKSYLWPKVKIRFEENNDLIFIKNKELRIAIFSLYPNNYNEIILSTEFKDTLGDYSIIDLLKESVNYENGEKLVKYHLSNYYGFLCK